MGNHSTTLFLNIDEKEIVTDVKAHGRVYLDVPESSGIQISNLSLRFLGNERTEVSYQETVPMGREARTTTKCATGSSVFLDVELDLTGAEGKHLNQGQHEFPFTFSLPKGSPSSMMVTCGYNDKCRVEYTLEAILKDESGNLIAQSKRPIIVVNSFKELCPSPMYIEPVKVPITSCFCLRKGEALLAARTSTSVLCQSEDVVVNFALGNNSPSLVKAVEITLKEQVSFRGGGHNGKGLTTVLYSNRFLPNAFPNFVNTSIPSKDTTAVDESHDQRILCDMLETDDCVARFHLPETARNSFLGGLITIKHVLSIRAVTAAGCENPTLMADVQVRTAISDGNSFTSTTPSYTSVPAGWKATVAAEVAFPPVMIRRQGHGGDRANPSCDVPFPPTTSLIGAEGGSGGAQAFAGLLDAVRSSYTPCFEFERWIAAGNRVSDLQDEQAQALFRAAGGAAKQVQLAGIYASAVKSVTCVLVVKVASVCKASSKREVVEKLLKADIVSDKAENASLVAAELTSFQYATVQKYLK
eukprot:CAMPEP_0170372906 /NCGR_PEP_ID=MMETSP0117_2-20130122/9796_1 /TAXON_ID=400756 /ORGANISM="Durinskia baltica, Strain CSIRO CS-38" /LENGTH=527 /DNA_ID=CAMNT_0010627783 /DNA_START=67 /DNA_END=1650 /DNA_ORIENTATION=-